MDRGDVVDVLVQEVDKERGRIGLKLVAKHENGGLVTPEELVERAKDAPPRPPREERPEAVATAAARASARKHKAGRRRQSPAGCPGQQSDPVVQGLTPPVPSRGVSKHQLTELATGERVISERVPGVRSVALGFWIGAGSRDEPDRRAGVSHFIEHLLFKGSARYSAQEIAEIFDELGGELNAATSRETTVVYARIPDDRLETALDVMADMVFRPRFADVDSEREVVLEEIAMVEDTPNDLVHDLAAEAVFGDASARTPGDRHAPR